MKAFDADGRHIVCFYFSFFLSFSYLCLHFLIVVNEKFRTPKVNSRFLVEVVSRAIGVEMEAVHEIAASTSLFEVPQKWIKLFEVTHNWMKIEWMKTLGANLNGAIAIWPEWI